jgi:peroxiredoxin
VVALQDDGGARHLVAGTPLPDVVLPSTRGGKVALAQLSGLNVLYIYPWTGRPGLPDPPNWDDIPGAHGSTPQSQGFRDLHSDYAARGIGVYGISAQDTGYQTEFATRLDLPFPLLSDEGCGLQKALSLPTFETGGVTYLKRLTLIVEDARITRCVYPVSDPAAHAAQLLATLPSIG